MDDNLRTFYAGTRCLVTGGCGFIGSNLARRLSDLGAAVRVIDAMFEDLGASEANVTDCSPRISVLRGDLSDPAVARTAASDQDVIFHLAADNGHFQSMVTPSTDLDRNCGSLLQTLQAARSRSLVRVVFTSTRQLYGPPKYLPVDEEHPVRPIDLNGVHKFACEEYLRVYGRMFGISSTILRLTNTYGPSMRIRDARQGFLGHWIGSTLVGREFEVWGGDQSRDLVYVSDVVDALLLAAPAASPQAPVFNVGHGQPVKLQFLAALLVRLAGRGSYKVVTYPVDRERLEIGDYSTNTAKIRAQLGWQAQVALEEGLHRTIAYFADRLDMYQ